MDPRVSAALEPEDALRFPAITAHGRAMLEFLREHPNAPVYRNASGHKLRPADIGRLRELEREALEAVIDWQPNAPPAWVSGFIARSVTSVPAFRAYGAVAGLTTLPTVSRADLARDIGQFVPDDVDASRLIVYCTSGTTAHPLHVASVPLLAGQLLY